MKVWVKVDKDGIPIKTSYGARDLDYPWIRLEGDCAHLLATPKSHRFLRDGSIIERKKVKPVISATQALVGEKVYYEIKDLPEGESAKFRVDEEEGWVAGGESVPIEATKPGVYQVELIDPNYRCQSQYRLYKVEVIDGRNYSTS